MKVITALCAVEGCHFGYTLGNGTVGVYRHNIRLWRIKVTLLAHHIDFVLWPYSVSMSGGMIAEWSACWTFDPAVGVPVPLAAGGRIAIVGQLLFAPCAWAYSTLHP